MTSNKVMAVKRILLICFIVLSSVGCASNPSKGTKEPIALSAPVVLNKDIKTTYCIPDEAARLIGQPVLSKEQLKKKTNAREVRISHVGQPVRADLHYDRLSVVIDAELQTIKYASCS